MRWTLAHRISISVAGVVVLAVFSSAAALLSSWHVGGLLRQTVDENLPSVVAAEELEIALLEQRGLVASYLADKGDPEWISQLEERKNRFDTMLGRARETAHTSDEAEILRQIEDAYVRYDERRDLVVRLYDEGDSASATRLLLNDVDSLYRETYDVCERFIDSNLLSVRRAVADAQRQTRWVSFAVGGCVLLTIGLGVMLLWLFFSGVVFPIRAMVADAHGFSGEGALGRQRLPTDEFRAVGIYLRNLMSSVADTRTTLEQSRRELRDAQKLAAVGKLAASVAHEIRNPLTAIKMWLFSIQKDVGGEEALDRKFDIVSEEIRRLEHIVRDFLEFSRLPELKPSLQSVPELLDATLELPGPRIANRGVEFHREDAPNLPLVLADREQFKQVLINLLNNSLEATSEGGRICVVTTAGSDGEGRPTVVVRVSDNGHGMTEEVSRRVFEPFFSTKDGGTGLGLPIAARIIAQHGGRLVLESSNDLGTTFAIHLPVSRAPVP